MSCPAFFAGFGDNQPLGLPFFWRHNSGMASSFISGLTSSSTRISISEGSVDCTDVFLDQIEERQMNKIKSVTELLTWFMALLLVAFVAGCGGGSGDPILGLGGGVQVDTTRPRVALTIPTASGVGSINA